MEEIRRPKASLSDVLPKSSQPRIKITQTESEPRQGARNAGDSSYFKKIIFWFFILIIIGGPIVFYTSQSFTRAVVTVEPRYTVITLDETLVAKRLPTIATSTSVIGFQTMSLEETETDVVNAIGNEKVSEKARGEIVIYNNYNSEPQQLIASTRFETPAGKIYRLSVPVTVPGG